MNRKTSGPLDKLIAAMPHGQVRELAEALTCSRRTILRWQKGARISAWNKLRLNNVAIAYGLKRLFPLADAGGVTKPTGVMNP